MSYLIAFAGRALIGLGGSFLFIAILRFCANWYRPAEFSRMSRLTLAVAGFGVVLATTPLALVAARIGCRRTVSGLALARLVVALVVALIARDSPSDAGLEPVGGVPTPETPGLRAVWRNARRVLGEPETWLASVILFAGVGVNITVFGLWGVPYLVQTFGLTVTRASTFTLFGTAGLLVGPPAIGYVTDHLGSRTDVVLLGVVYTVAFALLAVLARPPLAVVGVCFFLSGSMAGAYALVYSVVKERHGNATSGVATGTVNTIGFYGPAVLPAAMGLVLDAYWTGQTIGGTRVYTPFGYRGAFGLAAAVSLVAVGCAALLHRREHAERTAEEPATG